MAETYFRQVRSFAHPRMYGRYGAGSSLAGEYGGGGSDPASVISKAMADIGTRIEAQKQQAIQDQAANYIMNMRNPPRAQLVTNAGQGVRINPQTATAVTTQFGPGLSGPASTFKISPLAQKLGIQGTPQFAGGMDELQARADAMKLANEVDPVGAAVARARAAVAASRVTGLPATGVGSRGGTSRVRGGGGGGGGAGRPAAAAKPGKPPAYQPNTESNPALYNMDKMRTDFDSMYGKGSFDKVYPQLGKIQDSTTQVPQYGSNGKALVGADGKPVMGPPQDGLVRDAQGNVELLEKGVPKVAIGAQDIADKWQGRFNAARYNAGLQPLNLQPLNTLLPATSGQPGSRTNPYKPADSWGIASVPYGSSYIDPQTGDVKDRLSIQQKQQMASDLREAQRFAGGPPGEETSQTDDLGKALMSGDEQRIRDAVLAGQPDTGVPEGPQPSDFYPGSVAAGQALSRDVSPSDLYPGSAAVSQISGQGGGGQGGGFVGGGGTTGTGGATGGWGEGSSAPSPGPSALAGPSDLYPGSAALSYLSPMAATPPPVQPPDVSPNASGQAAATTAAAAATPSPSDAYVGLPGGHPDLPIATYLGGY